MIESYSCAEFNFLHRSQISYADFGDLCFNSGAQSSSLFYQASCICICDILYVYLVIYLSRQVPLKSCQALTKDVY